MRDRDAARLAVPRRTALDLARADPSRPGSLSGKAGAGGGGETSPIAAETHPPDSRRACRDRVRRRLPRMRAEPHRPVFVDEASVRADMTRLRGLAPRAERPAAAAPFGRWRTQTFVAGPTSDALVAP
jgi:hypothetical protein